MSNSGTEKVYWLKPNLLFVKIKDDDGTTKSILVDLEDIAHYRPNPCAEFLLEFLTADHGIRHSDLKAKLQKKYIINDNDADKAIGDLKKFLTKRGFNGIMEDNFWVPDVPWPDAPALQSPYPGPPEIQAGGSIITVGKSPYYKVA